MAESSRAPFMATASLIGLAAAAAAAAYAFRRPNLSVPASCIQFSASADGGTGGGSSLHPDPQHYEGLVAKIHLLDRLQHYPGLDVFGALRIPSTEGKEHKEFDIVILSKRKLYILEVKSWRGIIKSDIDGSWYQEFDDGSLVRLGNIIEEVKERSTLLEAYLSRRQLKLPSAFIQILVVIPNADSRLDQTILGLSQQVLTLQQLELFLRKETTKSETGCVNLLKKIPKKKETISRGSYARLRSILCTAPLWDRITLEGGEMMLGDFIRFDGRNEDMEALKSIKRAHVREMRININEEHKSRLSREGLILKVVLLVDVRCSSRDYRVNAPRRNPEAVAWYATVPGDVGVIFQCIGACTPRTFKLNALLSLELSA